MPTTESLITRAGTKKESSNSLIDITKVGVYADNVFYTSIDGVQYRLSDVLRQIETALTQLGHVWKLSANDATGYASAQVPGSLKNGTVGITLAPGTEADQSAHG